MPAGEAALEPHPLRGAEEYLTAVLRALRTHLDLEVAFLSEFRDGQRVFRSVDSSLEDCPVTVGGSDPLEDSYCQRVVDGRLPQFLPDPSVHPEAVAMPVTTELPVGTHFSVPVRLSDGSAFGTLCAFSRTVDPDASSDGLAVMRTMAEAVAGLVERERHSRGALDEMRADFAVLSQLTSTIAHDLKSPMATVLGYSELIEKRYGDVFDDVGRDWVETMRRAARYVCDAVDGLHELAMLEGDAAESEPVATAGVVDDVLDALTAAISRTDGQVALGDLPVVLGERALLTRLFQNLIANALKFAPPGIPPRVRIDARTLDGFHEFVVADRGIGIPEEDRQRVFDLFARADVGHAYPGSGLGLAVCRRIVERHGGTIRAEPNDAGGTRIVFTLPAA